MSANRKRATVLRTKSSSLVLAFWLAMATFWAGADPDRLKAKDYVLVLGGGPSIENSEFSIEQNVVYFQAISPRLGLNQPESQIFFASGLGKRIDVREQSKDIEPLRLTLSKLMGEFGSTIDINYRHNLITQSKGACHRDSVIDALSKLSRLLDENDRLLVYMTGHGGKGKPVENGHFHTWGGGTVSVREFTDKLDDFQPKTQVLLVMVQCYSGAFANIIYKGGNPDNDLSDHARAGFFASTDSFTAAGCTPEIKVEGYEDFSTYFWAALTGRDRLNQPISIPDIDRDRHVSGSEAFAYTLVQSPTIDVPVSTSDAFLRKFAPQPSSTGGRVSSTTGLDADRDFSGLTKIAEPMERYALIELTKRLNLEGENRMGQARDLLKKTESQQQGSGRLAGRLDRQARGYRQAISQSLTQRWPFLRSGWHPQTQKAIASDDREIWDAIKKHPSYKDWVRARKEVEDARDAETESEKTWRKLHRVIRLADTVVLSHNLRVAGDSDAQKRYQAIRRIEDSFFHVPISR